MKHHEDSLKSNTQNDDKYLHEDSYHALAHSIFGQSLQYKCM